MDQYLILFLSSCVLCVVSAYIYMKKDTSEVGKYNQTVSDIRGAVESLDAKQAQWVARDLERAEILNRLNQRLEAIEIKVVQIEKSPASINVRFPMPVKVLMKQVPPIPKPVVTTFNSLPGNVPKLKKQLSRLSQ